LSAISTNTTSAPELAATERIYAELEADGLAVLPRLLTNEQLAAMQRAFRSRLGQVRFNNVEGYEVTDRFRHMIQNVLLLEQAFVDLALHPLVTAVVRRYVGSTFALTEAKGWRSIATRREFHCWHADAWYEQANVPVQREIKLGLYLTDVKSGAFNYIRGTHRKAHPREYTNAEVAAGYSREGITKLYAAAGTAFLFDTTGIHRQGVPMLEPREAVFYCYHDPTVPLQEEDRRYNRYHPLLLNAAFLGGITAEQQRILGFGAKGRFAPGFTRKAANPHIHVLAERVLAVGQIYAAQAEMMRARGRRLKRIISRK